MKISKIFILCFLHINLVFSQQNDIFFTQKENEIYEANLAKEKDSMNKKIALKFEEISVANFFNILSNYYNVKFIISENANKMISIDVDEMQFEKAINVIEKALDLKIIKESNTYIVKSKELIGCNYNGDYFPVKTIKTIKDKIFICNKIEISSGDIFNKQQKIMWELFKD